MARLWGPAGDYPGVTGVMSEERREINETAQCIRRCRKIRAGFGGITYSAFAEKGGDLLLDNAELGRKAYLAR